MKRTYYANRIFGVDTEMVSPARMKEMIPIININGPRFPILGGLWQPRGGTARHDAVAWGYARAISNWGVDIIENRRPKLSKNGKEINAEGMYVLPGFIDMHGHIGGGSQGADADYVFKLWLAHGITTVREPGGRGIDYSIDLKNKSNNNEIIAPRLIIYSSFGSGSKKEISSPEEAREWVRYNAKKGADGIKFFGAKPSIMKAALDENNQLGLRSAMHHAQINVARWNVLNSAKAGLTSMEHWYCLLYTSPSPRD